MENCNPKLNQYFDSNYAKLQEEISLFIKGFPVIRLDGLASINDLIGQLIRQNSILAGRFRDQLGQIKEIYRKNEQHEQDVRRKQNEMSQLLTSREEQIESCKERLLQVEEELSHREAEVSRLAQETSRLEENQARAIELEAGFKELKVRLFSAFNELLEGRCAKNPDIFVEKFVQMSDQLHIMLAAFKSNKRNEEFRDSLQQESQQFCELMLEKFQLERQKRKTEKQRCKELAGTLDQLTAYVAEFGSRCKETANIFRIVPPDKTVLEKYCQGLEKELDQLEKNVRLMRDRQTEQTPSKRTIDLKLAAEVKQDRGAFEDILKTLAATVGRLNSDGSCRNRQHVQDIEKYKTEIKHLNEKLHSVVEDYETLQRDNNQTYKQQIATKEELLKYFEQNLIETKERLEEQQIRSDQLQEQLKIVQSDLLRNGELISRFEQEKQKILDDVEKAEQVIVHLEEEKAEMQEQLRDARLGIDSKTTHLVGELQLKEGEKKALVEEHEREKAQLLKQAESERRTQIELTQSLLALKQTLEKQNETLQLRNSKVAELESVNIKLLNEIASISGLVEELEDKVRTQSLELRGKEAQRLQQEKTIKGLLADNKNNLASLKSIKQEIPEVAAVKSALEQTEMKLARAEQENHSLKGLLKMARQDVNDSRKKLGEFIEVEQERQLLRLKCEAYSNQLTEMHSTQQESERRLKDLTHRCEQLQPLEQMLNKKRLELLQVQAQTSRLSIELKHARSLLHRVEQLQQLPL